MTSQGRHVDVSHLTDDECKKVINVISKDILLRKSEKERISYLQKRFEDLRRAIALSNSSRRKLLPFDDYCLLCGKNLFTFCCFIRAEECISCENFCCESCRKVLVLESSTFTEYFIICNLCIQKREVKSRSSEWYYEMVEKRFKRFGSAKALRAIYKQRKTIEPRVITLLALCRELQPVRELSFSAMKRKISATYSARESEKYTRTSSFSDFDPNENERTDTSKSIRRKRNVSDSELDSTKQKRAEFFFVEREQPSGTVLSKFKKSQNLEDTQRLIPHENLPPDLFKLSVHEEESNNGVLTEGINSLTFSTW